MNLFKRKVHLETSYGNAKYIREVLLNLKIEYETNVANERVAYTAYLTGRQFDYLSDYLGTLTKAGVYPVLLNEPA